MSEKFKPQEEEKPLNPQEQYSFEELDSLRWDTTDYAYPVTGWDILMPMDDEDIENLSRYAG